MGESMLTFAQCTPCCAFVAFLLPQFSLHGAYQLNSTLERLLQLLKKCRKYKASPLSEQLVWLFLFLESVRYLSLSGTVKTECRCLACGATSCSKFSLAVSLSNFSFRIPCDRYEYQDEYTDCGVAVHLLVHVCQPFPHILLHIHFQSSPRVSCHSCTRVMSLRLRPSFTLAGGFLGQFGLQPYS